MGEVVPPWSMLLHVPLAILHHIAQAFSFMIPCPLVVDIAERPLNWVGTRTIGR